MMLSKPKVTIDSVKKEVQVDGVCGMCGKKKWSLTVVLDGWIKWHGGALIQDAFPELPEAERELLLSGYCDPCYNSLGDPEED